jgi:hypothetical protein
MTIEDFGSNVRIEQRFAPVRPVPRSVRGGGDALTKAGFQITDNAINLDASGNPVWPWVIYQRQAVVDGIHPWTGEPTTETSVWMPVDVRDTEEDARAAAQALAGTLGAAMKSSKKSAKH